MTTAQLCIAWVCSLGGSVVPLPGCSKASRVRENFDAVTIQFTDEELKAINGVLESHTVLGNRYFDHPQEKQIVHLWS